MTEDLAARLQRLEDRESIGRLAGRYAMAMDDRDMEEVAAIFATDAVLTWGGGAPRFEGRAAIVGFYRDRLAPAGPSFHVTHDRLINLDPKDPDRATGLVLGHAENFVNGRHLVSAMRYVDDYLREEGEWRFARRVLTFLYQVPVETYPGILGRSERLLAGPAPRLADWPVSKLSGSLL